MRIWLDPFKLHNFCLQPSDVHAAIQAQNVQVSAGQIGAAAHRAGRALNATVTAQSRLQTPEQFRNIILKTAPGGAVVRLGDVARVELGADNYAITSLFNGHPAAGIAIMLAPGANALKTVDAVKAKADELRASLPPGMKMVYPVDNTTFIRLSIHDVIVTLIEAIALVVLVMYLFLQNWRATLIPAIAVPVVLLGTFGVLAAVGYSINTLTLFALVLVIGLLVDDAIVVVENVERIMHEEGLPPREATLKSMQEITGALIGIGLVLTAVFLPMAFFGGSTGVIYRQFSVTIVSAMTLSIMVALVLSPSLCATLLKPVEGEGHLKHGCFFDWFNRNFEAFRAWYHRAVAWFLRRTLGHHDRLCRRSSAVMALLFIRLPTGFLPDEDQGFIINLITLPAGRHPARAPWRWPSRSPNTSSRPRRRMSISSSPWRASASPAPARMPASPSPICATGTSARAPPTAPSRSRSAPSAPSCGIRDAQVFPLVPPSVQELGIHRLRSADGRPRQSRPCRPDGGPQQAAGPGGAGSAAGRRAPQQPGRHARSCISISTRTRPMRWAWPRPTSTPPSAPPGARPSSTISSIAAASSASICRAMRPTAWRRKT